jgi:hypothetical protein
MTEVCVAGFVPSIKCRRIVGNRLVICLGQVAGNANLSYGATEYWALRGPGSPCWSQRAGR